ncbi:MAG: TatD family hydrolase [Planctomycetota bacterium]|jgi:TatD DNase family protein
MIDTHCHLTFDTYDGRVGEILDRAAAAGVQGAISVGTTSAESRKALGLAETFDNVWCSAGVHPLYADQPIDWDELRTVAHHARCVAWGELGLDNHYDKPPRDVQDAVLDAHLRVIEDERDAGLSRPIIVHCREAFDELLDAFARTDLPPERFVFHCFTSGPEDARKILDFGAWISFTGVVTFKNAPEVAEAALLVPDDRIMVETDSPFLSPEPVRTMRPNEPCNVAHTARFLAGQRRVEPEAFGALLDANAARFFDIEVPPA